MCVCRRVPTSVCCGLTDVTCITVLAPWERSDWTNSTQSVKSGSSSSCGCPGHLGSLPRLICPSLPSSSSRSSTGGEPPLAQQEFQARGRNLAISALCASGFLFLDNLHITLGSVVCYLLMFYFLDWVMDLWVFSILWIKHTANKRATGKNTTGQLNLVFFVSAIVFPELCGSEW